MTTQQRNHMTVHDARLLLRELGMSIGLVEGDYRVTFKSPSWNTEAHAYYTNCLVDAVHTAQDMARRRAAHMAAAAEAERIERPDLSDERGV